MSCFQVQKANLVLKTCYLPALGTMDSTGAVDAYRTVMQWKNINMRDLLGTMYDNHDLFNLKLDSVAFDCSTSIGGNFADNIYAFGANAEDRCITIEMGGLSFANNSYDTKQGANTSTAVLASYMYDYKTPVVNYNDNGIVTFNKGTNLHDLTISYKRIVDSAKPGTTANAPFPQMVFHFSIYGIERERKPQRLIDMSM